MSCRTYQFRAYPTKAQAAALDGQLREACRLYNAAIQERRDAWRMARARITFASQCAQIKDIRAAGDIAIPNATTAHGVLRRVDLAFAAFFRRLKAGDKPGYPRFRSATRYDSLDCRVGNGAALRRRHVYASGVGEVRVKFHRQIEGTAKRVTFRRDAGRWYVSVVVDGYSEATQAPSPAAIGVDVGLTSFATLSDGTEIENPRHGRTAARLVRRARRSLSRKARGSGRRRKAAQRLRRALGRVGHQRSDFHHKVSRALVNTYGLIAVEDLNVAGLARTRLARSVHDAGWGSFIDKLSYKAESAGRRLVKVDPRGTSQTCPCGQAVPKELKERRHNCPACGLSVGRDHAAALVILQRGLRCQAPTGSIEAVA